MSGDCSPGTELLLRCKTGEEVEGRTAVEVGKDQLVNPIIIMPDCDILAGLPP